MCLCQACRVNQHLRVSQWCWAKLLFLQSALRRYIVLARREKGWLHCSLLKGGLQTMHHQSRSVILCHHGAHALQSHSGGLKSGAFFFFFLHFLTLQPQEGCPIQSTSAHSCGCSTQAVIVFWFPGRQGRWMRSSSLQQGFKARKWDYKDAAGHHVLLGGRC